MIEQINELVITESESFRNILDNENLGGRYCSFKSYYGDILKILSEEEKDTYIDQTHHFKALVKIGILTKGRVLKQLDEEGNKEEYPTFVKDKNGDYFPPEDITNQLIRMWKDKDADIDTVYLGIYRIKRNSYGFNCENNGQLEERVTAPVVLMLEQLNDKLDEIYNIPKDNEDIRRQALKDKAKLMDVNQSDIQKMQEVVAIKRILG